MARCNPFERRRFPREIILLAVRRDRCHAEICESCWPSKAVAVDASTIHRWVRKFGPEIRKADLRLPTGKPLINDPRSNADHRSICFLFEV
ncbi:hypothetical protein SIAM614_01549 [Stappia aggregata IAM 12614]|uniref:Transposase n=1 Tax=Roseibium aggregatum (strain ATCC 25650 / DSM 13394 / JCM 20685 / NBRC 16684 / NCIMB 2208 / IAM 12614 / B1) TaxID=384765 RepID=A0P0X0_ROSAI|nr:hypothetical protein SIAM614_01549 [Stappia aggregata IAM 12614] [Roseibium aggregatum IAM 12614]